MTARPRPGQTTWVSQRPPDEHWDAHTSTNQLAAGVPGRRVSRGGRLAFPAVDDLDVV